MRKHALATSLLLALSCSDDSGSSPTPTCAASEQLNPVTGTCESLATADVGPTADAAPVTDTAPAPRDLGSPTDMATPTTDMNPPKQDMGAPDMGMPPGMGIRFVAIGDQGEGNDMQRKVGVSMGTVCTSLGGCDFGLLLGDNFYDSGVDGPDDLLWQSMFEIPYTALNFPFYAVLGNHDLGGDGLGVDLDQNKANYQIEYGQLNMQWRMPARYYDFTAGPVHFVALDTTAIFFGNDDNQRDDVPGMIANAGDRWKIAFGHHPYYSNGKHGNAGEYDNVPFIPIANGENVKEFVEDRLCGNVDFYFAGHDHSRQDLVPDCQGTQFIVSGAGAKTTELGGNNGAHFEADTEGFLLVEATDTMLKLQFYDADGALEHERVVTR